MIRPRLVPDLVPMPGLKAAREAAGLTQLALAAASRVATNTIYGLESGKQKRVGRDAARRIAAALGVPLGLLVGTR
jgi:transcriptional regulator with XRE-family HTH domain